MGLPPCCRHPDHALLFERVGLRSTDLAAEIADWACRHTRTRSWYESPAYLQAVIDWREAWRPDEIRGLLVAERHVAELDGAGHEGRA